MIGKALSSEFNVLHISASQVVSKFVGETEQRVEFCLTIVEKSF